MRFSRFLTVSLLCLVTVSLYPQMTTTAPIKNFRLPRFGDNGYTQWMLQGEQGIYDRDEQVSVTQMAMRIYSGDERMALELSMDSPHGTLRLQENLGYSESPITIVGTNFKISGIGWKWSGDTKEIIVERDTIVKFTQGISGAFGDLGKTKADGDLSGTEIHSDNLVLRTTKEVYYFEFTGTVHAVSDQMDLKSKVLIALADVPEGRGASGAKVALSELDSINQIIARDDVTIIQGGKTIKANEVEFFPREQLANLSGAASVDMKGAYLSGETICSRSGEIEIAGTEAVGRAQMILTETGGLGIQGATALTSDTIILADTIAMREHSTQNHFLFKGSVEVMSGALQMQSARMSIISNKVDLPETAKEDLVLKVGKVKNIVADGGVRIEQNGQVATGEKVTFYPTDERAVLTGDPKVINGEVTATGNTMELKPKLAIISGEADDPVIVRLPKMPDLGYVAFAPSSTSAPKPKIQTETEATVVISNLLHIIEEPKQTLFRFNEDVQVTATNLDTTCKRLDIIAVGQPDVTLDANKALELQSIEAHENVVIKQTGRVATAKKATFLPTEGKFLLEGSAVVKDEQGSAAGHRITLFQGQGRAFVEGSGLEGERARVTLPSMSVSQ
ncbi:MAG: LptA/OstA family protein [Verrucomicrobiota bacterium]|nr:LptA/OstA family protein [Verrucomicrobiota bacterium]